MNSVINSMVGWFYLGATKLQGNLYQMGFECRLNAPTNLRIVR